MMGKALLIDRNYMALSIITWKKAIKLMVKGKAETIETNNRITITRYADSMSIPSIVRLVVDIPWRAHQSRMKFSRKNVMIRDNFECQYCEAKLGKGGTIDHVVPKTRGGRTTYQNCVACCKTCNNYKADKTVEQSGFKLKVKPKKPSFLSLYRRHLGNNSPQEWKDYIIGL